MADNITVTVTVTQKVTDVVRVPIIRTVTVRDDPITVTLGGATVVSTVTDFQTRTTTVTDVRNVPGGRVTITQPPITVTSVGQAGTVTVTATQPPVSFGATQVITQVLSLPPVVSFITQPPVTNTVTATLPTSLSQGPTTEVVRTRTITLGVTTGLFILTTLLLSLQLHRFNVKLKVQRRKRWRSSLTESGRFITKVDQSVSTDDIYPTTNRPSINQPPSYNYVAPVAAPFYSPSPLTMPWSAPFNGNGRTHVKYTGLTRNGAYDPH